MTVLNAGGSITTGNIDATSSAELTASGDIETGALTTGMSVDYDAGGSINISQSIVAGTLSLIHI